MGVRLAKTGQINWLGGLGVATSAALLVGFSATEAMAQSAVYFNITEDGEVVEIPTVQDEIVDVYFTQDKDYYSNHRFFRNIIPYIGIIENDIGGDGRRVHELYEELLVQQVTPVSVIRVADLPSPFTGSLATTPLYVEEPIPPAPIPSFIPPQRSTPVAPAPAAPTSIPALW